MLGFKLNHVNKRGPEIYTLMLTYSECDDKPTNRSIYSDHTKKTNNADVLRVAAVIHAPLLMLAVQDILFSPHTVHVIQSDDTGSILNLVHQFSTGEPQHTACHPSLFHSK